MKKISTVILSLIVVFSIMSFSANAETLGENFQQRVLNFQQSVLNFENVLGVVNSQIQQLPILSQQTKGNFQTMINGHVAWLESKRLEAESGLTNAQFTALSLEVYSKMVTIAHEVTLVLVTEVYIEGIDNVIATAQQLLDKAPLVVNYLEFRGCPGTSGLSSLMQDIQQNLDAAKQSHEATKQKVSGLTPGMPLLEELKILQETRVLSQQTINYLKEVDRLSKEFNSLMQQITQGCNI